MIRLFALLMIAPILARSQDIPKLSNTIFAKGVSFQQIKDTLLNRGYFIDQQNEKDGTIITREKSADSFSIFGESLNRWTVVLSIRVKDSTSRITGQVSYMDGSQKLWRPIEYWKAKDSNPHKFFMIMDDLSHAVSTEISYAKQ